MKTELDYYALLDEDAASIISEHEFFRLLVLLLTSAGLGPSRIDCDNSTNRKAMVFTHDDQLVKMSKIRNNARGTLVRYFSGFAAMLRATSISIQ
ncbi:MAG: hypothetical protein P8N76_19905 [Pirellulaceae bacterium]|nr:hypothetical protein [Pirellulaceae bacterium]